MIVYAVIKVYDPGAGEYSEEIISVHQDRKKAEDIATNFVIKQEEFHLETGDRLEKAGFKRIDYPREVEFYGDGGGRWASNFWIVKDLEIEE